MKWAIGLALFWAVGIEAQGKKLEREEGEFKIYAARKEIGTERFVISTSADSVTSSSTLDFRNPSDVRQRVQLETKLEMDARFVPRSYEFRSDVDGKKGAIVGSFPRNQAMFEYQGSGSPRKSGLLVGSAYTLLDTNIFHHFVFLARLFQYGSKDKTQRFEVVIPQESDVGVLRISEVGRESLQVRGKKLEAEHLQADSGSLLIDLWVDKQHVLKKIAVPSKGIEVLRN